MEREGGQGSVRSMSLPKVQGTSCQDNNLRVGELPVRVWSPEV